MMLLLLRSALEHHLERALVRAGLLEDLRGLLGEQRRDLEELTRELTRMRAERDTALVAYQYTEQERRALERLVHPNVLYDYHTGRWGTL